MKLGEQVASEFDLSGLLSTSDDEVAKRYEPLSNAQRMGAMFLTSLRSSEARRLRNADPGSVDPRYIQALTSEQSAGDALESLEAVVSEAPEFIEARLLRAWIRCQLFDTDAMLAEAGAIERIDPRRAESAAVRGVAHVLRGEFEEATRAIGRAARVWNADYRLDIIHGMALANIGKRDAAGAAFGRALIMAPDSVLALTQRAKLSLASGYVEHAIMDLSHVVELEPDNAEAFEQRGECYDRLKQYGDASSDYTRAFSISKNAGLLLKAYTAASNRSERETAETENTNESISSGPSETTPLPTPSPADASSRLQGGLGRKLNRPQPHAPRDRSPNTTFAQWRGNQ